MTKRTLTMLLLVMVSFTGTFAQNLLQHIPDNSLFVFGYNAGNLIKKGGQMSADMVKKQFFSHYNPPAKDNCNYIFVQKLTSNPADLGIDPDAESFIFNCGSFDDNGMVYLFPLKDAQKFISSTKFCTNEEGTTAVPFEQNGAIGWLNGTMAVATKGNIGMLYIGQKRYFYYNRETDSLYNDERIEELSEADSVFMNSLLTNPNGNHEAAEEMAFDDNNFAYENRYEERKKAMELKFYEKYYDGMKTVMMSVLDGTASSLHSNATIRESLAKPHDAWFWFNTNILNTTNNLFKTMHWPGFYGGSDNNEFESFQNNLKKSPYFNDNYTFGYLNFDKGGAEATFKNIYNPNLAELMRPAYDAKQSKELYKYIDASEMLGYISVAINMKELGNSYEKLYFDILNMLPKTGGYTDNVIAGIELATAFIDKETIFNTLDGRMIFAVTGMKEVRVKYKTYDYDEDYNRHEVERESIEKQPEMVLAATIGNQDRASKIFNAVKKFNGVTEIKKDVLLVGGSRYMKVNLYIVKTKKAFILTNSSAVALSDLNKGLPKSKQFSKQDRKLMEKNSLYANWQMSKTFSEISKMFPSEGINDMMSLYTGKFNQMSLYTEKMKGNSSETVMRVDFKDGETNGLMQIMDLIKQLYRY